MVRMMENPCLNFIWIPWQLSEEMLSAWEPEMKEIKQRTLREYWVIQMKSFPCKLETMSGASTCRFGNSM